MANCEVCGKKIGGFGGVSGPNEDLLARYRESGVFVPSSICGVCSMEIVSTEQAKSGPLPPRKTVDEESAQIPVLTVNPYAREGFSPLGLASAHVALGTGPISQIFSAVTDFFGEQSNVYSDKMREAENACIARLKRNAHAMGADAVIGTHTTYTELTSGHGMLLVCMTGTAVRLLKEAATVRD